MDDTEKLVIGDTVEIVSSWISDRFGVHPWDGCEGLVVLERMHRNTRFLIVSVPAGEREDARHGTVWVPELALRRTEQGTGRNATDD